MIYLLVVYAIGLGLMVLGFLWSREYENADSQPVATMIAYVFWPISLSAVALHVSWELYRETHRSRSSVWILTHS